MRAAGALLFLSLLLSGCSAPMEEFEDGQTETGGGARSGVDAGDIPPKGVAHVGVADWSEGDTWSYRIGVYLPGAEEPVLDSFSLENKGAVEAGTFPAYRVDSSRSSEDTNYTRDDLNPIERGTEVMFYDFPLWEGKTWDVTYRNLRGTAEVLGREERSATAGTFDAWRIKLTYTSGGYEEYWFSDAVKNEVRREIHSAQYRTITDLASYDVEAAS